MKLPLLLSFESAQASLSLFNALINYWRQVDHSPYFSLVSDLAYFHIENLKLENSLTAFHDQVFSLRVQSACANFSLPSSEILNILDKIKK